MKSSEKEVLEILNRGGGGLSVTRIMEILRSEHRGVKYKMFKISLILRKLEKKGLVSRRKTKYNYTFWRAAKKRDKFV